MPHWEFWCEWDSIVYKPDLIQIYILVYVYYRPGPPVLQTVIEAVGGHFPRKSNNNNLPCLLPLCLQHTSSYGILNACTRLRKTAFSQHFNHLLLFGSRIQKMSIWIRILGVKRLKKKNYTKKISTKSFKMTLKNH